MTPNRREPQDDDVDDELEAEVRPRRRRDDNIFVRNWLAIAILAISVFSSGRDGFGWMFGRESKEREMAAQIARLTDELQTARKDAADTYERKDLLSQKIDLINYRLTLIDERVKKVSEQNR